jgi:3',5'-cyclic AMP phosphodiesterase CpdA
VHPHPAAIVITGDLTDLGEPDAYRRLRTAVEPVASELGAPVVWVAGNHDERPALREGLLDQEPSQDPITGVWDLDGLRLIALDTSVPGWHHGDLDDGQLAWLADVLREPAPHGTLLAMHHPPLPSHVPLFDILELRHQDELAEVIRGSDVRGILAGHLHYSAHGTFAGVPVSVSSATCYTMNVARPAADVNGMDAAQAFQIVHVRPDTITHTVVPVADAPTGDHDHDSSDRAASSKSRHSCARAGRDCDAGGARQHSLCCAGHCSKEFVGDRDRFRGGGGITQRSWQSFARLRGVADSIAER